MNLTHLFLTLFLSLFQHSFAEVAIDEEAFGKSLGGWKKRDKSAAEYPLSGADYRTYKPETSPTPDGGIFMSVRIDHVRGWLSSDDHAILEISVNSKGAIVSAQSTIAIQGQSIKSDVILGGNEAGKAILTTEGAVQIGTDLVANLTAKLLRENIVEAGRVSFPAVLRHNYNHLFQSIRVDGAALASTTASTTVSPTVAVIPAAIPVPNADLPAPLPVVTPPATPPPVAPTTTPPAEAPTPAQSEKPAETAPSSLPLQIKPYG